MKKMTHLILVLALAGFTAGLSAQETDIEPASEAAEGLDLHAVSELFKEAADLESFEKTLNDPETGINNLDLDDNGEVDYIRVVEENAGNARLIILQVPLADDDYQDVATIEVEPGENDEYDMQVTGDEVIYGPDYYVAPVHVRIATWPIIRWLYRPGYRPYVSVYRFGHYPRWWKPRRPVTYTVYRTRVVPYRARPTFRVTHTRRVTVVHRVHYAPRASVKVKKTTIVKPAGRPARVRQTTVRRGGAATRVRK
ncbi:hypothetical protein JXO52_14330 [bacterium]|nr:hypothetical protein [bacterium]